MMIVVSLILALFVAAVIAFILTGVRGWLGHYDPAWPQSERETVELEAVEEAA